jgi:hypothetical protein
MNILKMDYFPRKKRARAGQFKPFLYRVFLFYLILNSQSSGVHAEISYKDLKGVHQLIKSEYQAYSPVLGYVLLSSESLRNYRFLGNYGKKRSTHGCMEMVRQYRDGFTEGENQIPGLIAREDCPQDFTSEWIQRLFPSVDGHIFSENGAKKDLISHLKPRTLGKLLARIAKQEDSSFTEDSLNQELIDDLKTILFQDLDPVRFQKNTKL